MAGLAAGCLAGPATFACKSDAECDTSTTTGFCETTGYCAFVDRDCPSGRRYGALAPHALRGHCVDDVEAAKGDGTSAEDPEPPTPATEGSDTDPGTTGSTPPDRGDPADPDSGGVEPVPVPTTGGTDPGDGTGTSTTEALPPGPGQPPTGAWAHCLDGQFDNCTAPDTICIFLTPDNEDDDGFCTRVDCADPFADCGEVPSDSNATPICVQGFDADGSPLSLCALSCADGESCPDSMVCRTELRFDPSLPTYDMCM